MITRLVDVDVELNNLPDGHISEFEADFEIVWDYYLEERDWGIKSIMPAINEIKGNYWIADVGNNNGDVIEVNVDCTEWDIEYTIIGIGEEGSTSLMLKPLSIELDVQNKKVVVLF